jgi:ABC-type multidrug transport system fused ATPase/permease subunit
MVRQELNEALTAAKDIPKLPIENLLRENQDSPDPVQMQFTPMADAEVAIFSISQESAEASGLSVVQASVRAPQCICPGEQNQSNPNTEHKVEPMRPEATNGREDGMCFARYDVELLDRSMVQKPIQRRPVKVACPSHFCAPNTGHEWICFKCHAPIEYGYTDQYIYCNCGRSMYGNYEFKCKEAQHGSLYERYNQAVLLQLLNALEPYNKLNILILGETGAGKSTLVNANENHNKGSDICAA